jgi:hypothetical protein
VARITSRCVRLLDSPERMSCPPDPRKGSQALESKTPQGSAARSVCTASPLRLTDVIGYQRCPESTSLGEAQLNRGWPEFLRNISARGPGDTERGSRLNLEAKRLEGESLEVALPAVEYPNSQDRFESCRES